MYNKPPQRGILAHFRAIADQSPVPIVVYNVPGRTGCDLHNDTTLRLAQIPNIVGIKDATGDLPRGQELIGLVGERMAVYSGDDATAIELILLGGKGGVWSGRSRKSEVRDQLGGK